MWIADAARSREIDRIAIGEYGIPARVLMERAGMAVFEAVRELLPDGGRIAVVCGSGNNGGDGFVVARLAAERGFDVVCLVAALEDKLSPEASEQMRVTRAQGVTPQFCDDARYEQSLSDLLLWDLIVDGLLGTGARGEVRGEPARAIDAIADSGVPVVSIDIPSGIDCDTGEEMGTSVLALRTVTFGLPKPFLFQGLGLEHSGYWTVADIGFPGPLLVQPTGARLVDEDWVASLLPERLRDSHKGSSGSVLIVAGSERMPGAAVLAALGALRSGAGLVTVASVPSVCRAVCSQLPEVMVLPLPEEGGVLSPDGAALVLERQAKCHSAVFGPGLTNEPSVRELLATVWREWKRPCVLDADALNAISCGVPLPEAEAILTPHPGELSRLMQSSLAEIQADRFRAARLAVDRFGMTVLLKGPFSIAGHPGEPLLVNQSGNSGMATGGMGDVLSGVAGTLLAQDLSPVLAAACAMYWHGFAGDLCAEEIGSVGFLASELADRLPRARGEICDCEFP